MAAIFNFTGNLSGRLARIPEPETVPADGYYTKIETDAAIEAAIAAVVGGAPAVLDTLKEIADVIGTETGSGAAGILKRVADLESGKADKAEMSVTPVAGSLDKTTIQLKSGTSATVLTAHQDIRGKVDKNETTVVAGLGATATGDGAVAVGPVRANGQGAGASAEGNTSVALGYWSRATAFGAVQVGYGVNSTQNSFQFRAANLFVESDGAVRLGAGFPAATTAAPGSMSAADKAKLNGIAAGATAVTVDSALSQTSENPVQNKAVAAALAAKLDGAAAYAAWDQPTEYDVGYVVSYKGSIYRCANEGNQGIPPDGEFGPNVWDTVTIGALLDEKQNALTSAQLAAVNSGVTAAKVATWDGYASQIAQKANSADVATALAQKANATDLPYAMVTPGEWEFSDGGSYTMDGPYEVIPGEPGTSYYWDLYQGSTRLDSSIWYESTSVMSVEFPVAQITATRPSLPGHLLDRANNLIDATTGNVTLTLPPFVAGKVRDLLVHVNLGDDGTDPYTVTVNFPSGETNTGFKVKGNASAPLPAPDAAGEWLFSFSESSPHKMAVSLAQLQDATVAGGS